MKHKKQHIRHQRKALSKHLNSFMSNHDTMYVAVNMKLMTSLYREADYVDEDVDRIINSLIYKKTFDMMRERKRIISI
jgi:ATP-dependent protease Clp ATPase subunit